MEIALTEILNSKQDKKEAAAQDDEGMGNNTTVVLEGSTKTMTIDASIASKMKLKQKNYLGTSRVIKLPYIIGSSEFDRHPYAGVVFMGEDELEQLDLYQEEVANLLEDKKHEEELLVKNAQDMEMVMNYEQEVENAVIA